MASDGDTEEADELAKTWRHINHIIQEVIHTEKGYFRALKVC